MNKRVLLLGSKGMLGSCVYKYFKVVDGVSIYCANLHFNDMNKKLYSDLILDGDFDYIVNCVGAIPQKTNDFSINWELPQFLAEQTKGIKTKIIHASTDCEFSGNIKAGEFYSCIDKPDAIDAYGLSKIKGSEAFLTDEMKKTKKAIIFRTSIIGLEPKSGNKGLLGWFLSNRDGDEITGFTNKWWNGITTLQWAKFCYLMILYDSKVIYGGNGDYVNIFQPATEPISKYRLLCIMNKIFDRNIYINSGYRTPTERKILKSNWSGKLDNIDRQLLDLKYFYDSKLF